MFEYRTNSVAIENICDSGFAVQYTANYALK
jgi:hypothetical protein